MDEVPLDALTAFLDGRTLWFLEVALQEFSLEQLVKVFLIIQFSSGQADSIQHISFEPLMNSFRKLVNSVVS